MSVVAYHFWSPTCAPCKVIKPAVEDLKEEFTDVEWVSVNTHDDVNDLSKRFSVSVVPTIVITKNEQEVGRHSGTNMSIYYSILRKARST
jgi:thioredoxin 1